MFKWDKEQVDRQESRYLMNVILINMDMIKSIFEGLGKKAPNFLNENPFGVKNEQQ